MASDDAAKKRKPRGRSEASGAAVAAVPEAGVAVTAVAAGALAEDTGKKKKKKKRKRQQVLEGEREGAVGAGLGATCVGNDDNEPRTTSGSKRRKKKGQGGKRQRPAMAAAATASITTACGTPGAGAAVSSQPLPTLACTGKVAEYAAIGGSTTAPPPASVERETSSQSTKKKKKKKAKKDKRDKKGRAEPSCHVTHTPPSVPGRAGENASFNETHDHADASSGSKHDSNRHDDDPVLEGIVHDGTMYLVDAAKKVFSAQRDEGGNLVEVGTYDGEAVTIDPVDLPAAGASSPCGDDPAEAGVRGAAGSSTRGDKGQGKAKGKKDGAKVEDASETESGAVVDYPFEVEECDHCETSERAYADIAPLLLALAAELGKAPEELVIYDPYFCQGSTVARLASLGFPRVHNRKEDFYEVVKSGTVPEHDVLVTNPPFSGEHVPQILSFCARKDARPWLLLLPNYVYLKDYYETSLGRGPGRSATLPFYLTPPKRYMYYSPAGSRLKVKSSERKTSPFNTFWYIHLGDGGITSKILQSYDAVSRKAESEARCCVARTTQQIPYKMMDSNDPRRKKARDRQRSIDRIRKKKSEWVLS